ncbi:MAG: M64 family metallopeptidase [Vicinamibacterales bacterium]
MSSITSSRPLARAFQGACLALALSLPASAQTVTQVRANGPSANRIDIAILGDGYTAAELAAGKYTTDVETMLQGLFAQQPYAEYRNYYNVFRIDVVSAESGADHPENGTYRNTALDAAYNCAAIQRLICVNNSKVSAVIAASGLAADQHDLTLVLVNDTTYGGSGGAVAVASLHPQTVELVLHETGHTFALLGDEYGGTPTCTGYEPAYPDLTTQSSRAGIKWNLWIDPATPVPTTTTSASVTGLFSGGNYCDSGYYRPTYDSKMRTLGVPFYAVNQEAHVLRIYNFVSPIDSSSPAGTTLTIGASQTFSVTPTVPATHALSTTWTVDGVQQGIGAQFTASNLAAGTHTVVATVADGTSWVRNDPTGLMNDVRTWTVTVQGNGPGAFAKTAPAAGATVAGTTVTLAWSASSGAAAYEYCLDSTNDNACAAWSTTGASTSVVVGALTAGTTYYWQARASATGSTTYADGASTAFAAFTVPVPTPQPVAPGSFAKVGPANGATAQPVSLTLSWGASSGASGYEYCIDTTNDNACAAWTSTGAATSASLSNLSAATTYYWQARAVNAGGTTYANGAASAYASVSTVSAPGAFAKLSPASGLTGLKTAGNLTWNASSGAARYEYCIDTTNDNACGNWLGVGTATSVAIAGLANGTAYYWHVRAVNAGGTTYAGGSATAFNSFTTQLAALPGAFGKAAPASGASGLGTSVPLSWSASSGVSRYEYCFDTTNDNACATWISAGTSLGVTVSGLAAGTTYYWEVRAVGTSGTTYADGAATAYANFSTLSAPVAPAAPGAFAKLSPSSGLTGLKPAGNLTWSASSGAVRYEYCIDTMTSGACAVWVSVGTSTSAAVSGLASATTYYWQVRAIGAGGAATYANGSAGAYWNLTTR